jgi:hypothetical protein
MGNRRDSLHVPYRISKLIVTGVTQAEERMLEPKE